MNHNNQIEKHSLIQEMYNFSLVLEKTILNKPNYRVSIESVQSEDPVTIEAGITREILMLTNATLSE